MEIEITDTTLVHQIQERFNKVYPCLWIDFLAPGEVKDSRLKKFGPEVPMKRLCNFKGIINANSQQSVAQLEKDFWEIAGLRIMVLRRSANVWVGTRYTRHWTLENQNYEGAQINLD